MVHQKDTLEQSTARRETAFGRMRSGRPSGRIVAQPPLRQRLRHIGRQWRLKLKREA